MFKRISLAAALYAAFVALPSFAASVNNQNPGRVIQIDSYAQLGGGDVTFRVDAPVGACTGLWLKPADAGFKQNVSLLTAAYMADQKITVWADDAEASRWQGSGSQYCKVDSIRLTR